MCIGGLATFGANLFMLGAGEGVLDPIVKLVSLGLTVNLALGIFNLIPVPPLDGGGMLESVLPREAQNAFEQIKPYGFMLLFALMMLGAFGVIFFPVMRAVVYLLQL